MLKKIPHEQMGKGDLGWLKSIFHFSFAQYFNPKNMDFGVLRVLNDDLIAANKGFEMHPHKDMEILSYVIDGELTHGDTMGNRSTLTRGQMQYMSAGTGVFHSEYNLGNVTGRFLQIWIQPDKKGHTPQYGDVRFEWKERENRWLHMVSSKNGTAPIKIHQDVNVYAGELLKSKEMEFQVAENRQAYMVQIEGCCSVNDQTLFAKDALLIVEESITLKADENSHVLMIEMKKKHSS